MAQMWLPRRPKGASTRTGTTKAAGGVYTPTTTTTTTTTTAENGPQNCCCGCLARIVKKLKRQGRMLRAAAAGGGRQSPNFQCRYDPLSYSLNFDRSECGSLLDDGDYYQFCAFSSRFVANPRTSCTPSPTPVLATSH